MKEVECQHIMSFFTRDKLEFNGYLRSLRYICDKEGLDSFCIENDCDLGRVQKLRNSDLGDSNYILPLLWSETFEDNLSELLEKNKSIPAQKIKAQDTKRALYKQIKKARYDYCGIGTKKVKWLLNSLLKEDTNAKILRMLLEIEDVSISAKISYGEFSEYRYKEKEDLIFELINIYKSNSLTFGYKKSDNPTIESIIFFNLSGGQFSWHTNCQNSIEVKYTQAWDGLINSNLKKIEKLITQYYGDILETYNF